MAIYNRLYPKALKPKKMGIGSNVILLLLLFSTATTFAQNDSAITKLKIPSTTGPESLAFDSLDQGPYTGVADGRILKWEDHKKGWRTFATLPQWSRGKCRGSDTTKESICGRPLGLQFNKHSGELYIADSYFGLHVVGPQGGIARQLAAEAGGVRFMFTNGLDVDQNTGVVYFTDSSSRYHRWDHRRVLDSRDATGRLMRYDPATKEITVLLGGLTYPNGVAVSQDGSFVFVASYTDCTISRYWLQGPNAGQFQFFKGLSGYPDNIKINAAGEFWVAVNKKLFNLMFGGTKAAPEPVVPEAVRLNRDGLIVSTVEGIVGPVSEVLERNGTLWLGSLELPYVRVLLHT